MENEYQYLGIEASEGKKKKTAEEWHVFIAPRLAGQEPEHPDKEAKDNE